MNHEISGRQDLFTLHTDQIAVERPIAAIRGVHNLTRLHYWINEGLVLPLDENKTVVEIGAGNLFVAAAIHKIYGCDVLAIDDESMADDPVENPYWDTEVDPDFQKEVTYSPGDTVEILQQYPPGKFDLMLSFGTVPYENYGPYYLTEKYGYIHQVLKKGASYIETYIEAEEAPEKKIFDKQFNPFFSELGFECRWVYTRNTDLYIPDTIIRLFGKDPGFIWDRNRHFGRNWAVDQVVVRYRKMK